MGSPTYDYWGGDRNGAGLFGDCLLALDLRTGKRLWHFQTVHHDLWDYDPTTAPKLLTVRHNGKTVDVVAQATKSGFLFVFDRVSGKPLWPIEERPVPKSDAPGEESWPTQPVPTKPPPFARQSFTANDVNPYVSDEDKARILEILRNTNNHGIFTPGTDKSDSIQIPADDGGANWGNGAADPKTGMVYLRTADSPELKYKLTQKLPLMVPPGATPETQGHVIFSQLCQGCHGPNRTGVMSPKDIGIDKFKKIVTRRRRRDAGILRPAGTLSGCARRIHFQSNGRWSRDAQSRRWRWNGTAAATSGDHTLLWQLRKSNSLQRRPPGDQPAMDFAGGHRSE